MTQYLLNLLLWSDLTLSTILAGCPRDTVSARLGRARAAGSRPACAVCAALTWVSRTLLRQTYDHCAWAIKDGASIGREIWHWGPK